LTALYASLEEAASQRFELPPKSRKQMFWARRMTAAFSAKGTFMQTAAKDRFPPLVSIDTNGPKPPFIAIIDAAVQLPKNSRSSRTQHF
jgi:hypothetical protein